MAELESLHTRRTTQQESTTVPMTDINSDPEYATPFQHQQQSQPQRHYNVSIPAVDQWPGILARVLRTSATYIARTVRDIREGIQDGSASSGKYQNLPTTIDSSSSFRGNSFGGRRHSRNGGGATCFSRRIGRILFFLVLVTLVTTWLAVPKNLKPFQNRDIWIKYYNHAEAIKIPLPYSRVVHVYDLKKVALKELDRGYISLHSLSEVRLMSGSGLLEAGEVWDNDDWRYQNSYEQPILMVSPGNELFQFLNDTLGCFSGPEAYNYNVFNIKFSPEYRNYSRLARILHRIGLENAGYVSPVMFYNADILYLRKGFGDPLQLESLDLSANWVPPAKPKYGRGFHFMDPIRTMPSFRPDVSWAEASPVAQIV
ncbi:hypothetical protein BGZ80_002444 [Entomortierella chlamydospora]|uniref:Uncharacterized protein n=1 Tax=Entomortierella chlamydospora TaxID=101097 RepID=A0A9P6MPF5_9FUNG|nr:hypothetical protein BGZ79_000323 [Entomortierella chlamydospora]KAG0009400.1 hypothetical protein BGZ80_002444 [Entomortierella chlamydospora]